MRIECPGHGRGVTRLTRAGRLKEATALLLRAHGRPHLGTENTARSQPGGDGITFSYTRVIPCLCSTIPFHDKGKIQRQQRYTEVKLGNAQTRSRASTTLETSSCIYMR